MVPAILVKISLFLKKNWKIIAVLVGLLYFSGALKQIVARFKINSIVKSYTDSPAQIDYNYIAMQVNEAFDKALWFIDRGAITSLINSLSTQSEFMTLVRVYAVTYNKDLRADLRDRFNDKQYSGLKYK